MRLITPLLLIFCSSLMACSSYTEDLASEAFEPIMPDEEISQAVVDGAIYDSNSQGLFATERKASKVGDIVTVSLSESFQASKSQSTASGKDDSLEFTLPTTGALSGVLASDVNLGTKQSFAGTGTASQSNAITGLVSASVVRVYANGNLEILGQKKLTLNNGDEYVRVKGIVRPQDIGNGNIVNSNRLANAEITYIGAGELADTSRRGWLSKLFGVVSPI
jgi:flagellar L-ring protein FlgH